MISELRYIYDVLLYILSDLSDLIRYLPADFDKNSSIREPFLICNFYVRVRYFINKEV